MIGDAVDADAPALADVFLAAWRGAYRGVVDDAVIDGLDRGELERLWRRLVAEHRVLVARENGRAIGMVRFGPDPDEPSRGHFFSLYVHPRSSGGGVGRALLDRASAELSAAGFRRATLWVFAANDRALRFYRANGWEPTGETRVEDEWGAPELRLATELAEREE